MGPITTPWILSVPSRRWLAVVALPLALAIAIGTEKIGWRTEPSEPPSTADQVAMLEYQPDLDEIARAHRSWVADHGSGCARAADHLEPYLHGWDARDRFGRPVVLTCDRAIVDGVSTIQVSVRSAGPDSVLGTIDDETGVDLQRVY